MRIIVAADENWAIGKGGQLLVSIPEDQRLFRRETEGKVVVFGRRTLDTFPAKQPLANRTNIILSRDPDFKVKGALVLRSLEELFEETKKYPPEDVYVIGGESVYRQLLPHCDMVQLTKIDYSYEADAHFPDLDADPEWKLTGESEEGTYFDLEYRFLRYERVH
ncbi:MAG: dihydrofolate reductase [Lachnospiraceae bacterium]|nr:dihydrofolate reductase [Lachnospiraceae bacterium]